MAILPALPGLEIVVQSMERFGAVDMVEYEDDGPWTYRKYGHLPAGQRSSKYVESKEGAEFRIRIILRYPFQITSQAVSFKASVDGHGIAQALCTANYYIRAGGNFMELITAKLDRINSTEISSRPLRFSTIKKVDDADAARVQQDIQAVAGLGEICVSVFRTLQRDPIVPPLNNFRTSQHNPVAEVSEKALKGKAISHGVAYGQEQVVTRHYKETIDVDGSNNPLGVFIFKYRSREDLQAEMILPRTPSPVSDAPRSQNQPPIDRQERLAHLKREIKAIKAEDLEDIVAPQPQKRRNEAEIPSGRAYKTSRTSSGAVVVDLTDD